MDQFERYLADDPDVEHWSSYVGHGAVRFLLSFDVQPATPNFGQIVIVTRDLEARERVRAALGLALLEAGRTEEAANLLDAGADLGWEPAIFRAAVRAHVERGDPGRALRYLAHLAADPGEDLSAVAQFRLALPRDALRGETWDEAVRDAEFIMRRQVLELAGQRALMRPITVLDRSGRRIGMGGRSGISGNVLGLFV